KYLPANPASSYRGIHESLINYGKNTMPEFLTCTHEESGVAMCHGYFKATGKPIMTLVHGTVGLQHATMAVYNAWCDRVPRQRHRLHAFRIQHQRKVAGTAQANRAWRNASSGPWRS